MNLLVDKPTFGGTITIPASKSHTIRALLCASLADKPSIITAPLISADTMSAIVLLRQLGVTIIENEPGCQAEQAPLTLKIIPPAAGLLAFAEMAAQKRALCSDDAQLCHTSHRMLHGATELDLGNSGSLLYFLGILLAAAASPVRLTGDESLRMRPVAPLLAVYRQAGIPFEACRHDHTEVQTDPGSSIIAVPPLTFCGPLSAGTYRLTGPFSQPVTGLLFAAPLLDGLTRIIFDHAGERPYLKMTCAWLYTAGITVVNQDEQYFEIHGKQRYQAFSAAVPGDWSSALFPLTAAVICNAELTLTNLDPADTQGDVKALDVLRAMGADIRCDAKQHTVSVRPIAGGLKGGCFCCADIPDAVPALAAAALFCAGETLLTDAGVCRFKECDRLAAAAEELAKFGAHIMQEKDFLRIEGTGGTGLHPARVWSRKDHRIAMMLAVAACGIAYRYEDSHHSCPISCIEDFDCVNVSYPTFIEDMNAAGSAFQIETGMSES